MQNSSSIIQKLIKLHPQFSSKQTLIDYYMNFQFPEKQRKSAVWWEDVLKDYLIINKKLTFTLVELQQFFSFHGLKPLPIKNILNFYMKKNTYDWVIKKQQIKNTGWWGKVANSIWRSDNSNINPIVQNPNAKIFSMSLLEQKVKQSKYLLSQIFQKGTILQCQILQKKLNQKLNLQDDLQMITIRLKQDGILQQSKLQSGQFIFMYSKDKKNLASEKWISLQKAKYLICKKIDYFDQKITQKCKRLDDLVAQAKQFLQNDQRQKAKMILKNHKNYEKSLQNFNLRKQALFDTLRQIQFNQIDNQSIDVLKISQDVIKSTMKDVSQVQQIIQKGKQIKIDQKIINQQFKEAYDNKEDQQSVQEMMRQIQNQVKKQEQKKSISKERLARPLVNNQKNNKMDIQEPQKLSHPMFKKAVSNSNKAMFA